MTISATAVDVLPVYMDSIHDGEYIYAKNQQLGYNQNKHQLHKVTWCWLEFCWSLVGVSLEFVGVLLEFVGVVQGDAMLQVK